MVGLTWQLIFTLEFLDRFPYPIENLIIGIAIWLAYTADRILDSRNLEKDLPHSSRHQFHHQFQTQIGCLWILTLGLNVVLIARFTSAAQIKWGVLCSFFVFLYLLNSQKNFRAVRAIPKEAQAGLIFAFGVSLACWSSAPPKIVFSLFTATLVTGVLFSINCAAVAYRERQLDEAQVFFAWTSNRVTTLTPIAFALALEFTLILAMLYFQLVSTFITSCLLSSTSCLAIAIIANQRHNENQTRNRNMPLTRAPEIRDLLADLSLILSPATLVALRFYHG
ncbi:MAG: hypothetical protein CMM01_12855 [Rhodopirellula sp.]|nr:hypothetical protein [Rhodopirellula sp.]MAI71787.1 hypothetical protein [Rhodopirellula sp.]